MQPHDLVLILDFGSQVTQLIARRVREMGCYSEVHPCNISAERIRALNPKAIILSGGPATVTADGAPAATPELFTMGLPVLGICYGQQWMCQVLGGNVSPAGVREYGRAPLKVVKDSPLFAGVWQLGEQSEVWMSHGDTVDAIPSDFEVLATTEHAPYALVGHKTAAFYGLQFHPEVTHTPQGTALLRNFVLNIAKVKNDWTMVAFMQETIDAARTQVGDKHIICAVSGGVDSSVVAVLLHRALPGQVHCVFVDTGLLRGNEVAEVQSIFARLEVPLTTVNAAELFLGRLAGVQDPEAKRKIIGASFIEVFDQEASKLKAQYDCKLLAQGTLYPDVIESVSFSGGPSVTIKSHHNVGGLPERMQMGLVEPLRALFKDEVRKLGRELGIAENFLGRHPFPGPGLAIRIPGAVTAEKVALLQQADKVYIEALREFALYDKIWQAFAVLLPVQTVVVMGDGRTYDYVLALRAVTSSDGMTADYYPFEHSFLQEVSSRITNKVRGISRVVYDVTSKPPATIEW